MKRPLLICAWLAGLLGLCVPRAGRAERRLSLGEALALAKRSRSEVTQAGIDLDRARLGVLRARLERIHLTIEGDARIQVQELNVQLTGQGEDSSLLCMFSPDSCNNESHVYGGRADLTIPLWTGFSVESDIARARWLLKAGEAQRRSTLRTVALDVAHAYWAVRRAELLRDVEAQAVRRDQEIERVVERRVAAGIAPQVDYNRAHVIALRERSQLELLEGQVAEAQAQLAAVLQIDEEIALSEDPLSTVPLLPPLAAAVAEAQTSRPELFGALAQVAAQAEATRSARGGYWPRLELFAHADAQNANVVFQALPQEQLFGNFYAGARVSYTIFDTLTTWAQVRDSELQRARLEADRVRLRYTIDADVRAAHARLRRGLAQRGPLDEAVRVARDNLSIIEKRYQAGDALILDLLDAQVQLLRSESDLVDNAVSIAQSQSELDASVGRL